MSKTDRGAAERRVLRVLRFLKNGPAVVSPAARTGMTMLQNRSGAQAFETAVVASMARDGLIDREKRSIDITDTGQAALKRGAAGQMPFAEQHRELETATAIVNGEMQKVTVNCAESPLTLIARRKDRNGLPFLTAAQVDAGERLRRDYERGSLSPRLCSNWDRQLSGSSTRGPGAAAVELTDASMAARRRVQKAVTSVGPELSGVLIDILCFHKGFALVESERGWPQLSAKVMLKTALASLARHYQPETKRSVNPNKPVSSWGAPGYRPQLAD